MTMKIIHNNKSFAILGSGGGGGGGGACTSKSCLERILGSMFIEGHT